MIGSNQMDIDGIREDGTRVPLFRNGNWANQQKYPKSKLNCKYAFGIFIYKILLDFERLHFQQRV